MCGSRLLQPGQPDRCKRVGDPLADDVACKPQVLGTERDVVLDRGRDDLVVGMLEHDTDELAQLPYARLVARRDTVDGHGAALRQQDPVREARERRLAGTVGAQDRDLFPGCDREGHAIQRTHAPGGRVVRERDVVETEHGPPWTLAGWAGRLEARRGPPAGGPHIV